MPVMRCDTRQSHLWIQQPHHHQQQNEERITATLSSDYLSAKPIFRPRHFDLEAEAEVENNAVAAIADIGRDYAEEKEQETPTLADARVTMADLSATNRCSVVATTTTTNNNSSSNGNKNLLLQQQSQERHLSPKARMNAICERLKSDTSGAGVMTMSDYGGGVAIEPTVKRPWADHDDEPEEEEEDGLSGASFSDEDVGNNGVPAEYDASLCDEDENNMDDGNGLVCRPPGGANSCSTSASEADAVDLAARISDDDDRPEVDQLAAAEDDDMDDEDERFRRDLLMGANQQLRGRSSSRGSSMGAADDMGNGPGSADGGSRGAFDDEDADDDVMTMDENRGAIDYGARYRVASGLPNDDDNEGDEDDDFDDRRGESYFAAASNVASTLDAAKIAYRGQLLSTTTVTGDYRFDEQSMADETAMVAPGRSAISAQSSTESRRNKRKNFKPRNIVYQFNVRDEPDNEYSESSAGGARGGGDAGGDMANASTPPSDGFGWEANYRQQQQQQLLHRGTDSPPSWNAAGHHRENDDGDSESEVHLTDSAVAIRSRSPSPSVPSALAVASYDSRSPSPPLPSVARRVPALPSLLASSLSAGSSMTADGTPAPRRGDSEQPLDLSDIATVGKRPPLTGPQSQQASRGGNKFTVTTNKDRDDDNKTDTKRPPVVVTSTPMDLTITRSPPEYVGMTSLGHGGASSKVASLQLQQHHQQQQQQQMRGGKRKDMHGVDIIDLSRAYGHHHPLQLLGHHGAAPLNSSSSSSSLNDMEAKFASGVMVGGSRAGSSGSPGSLSFAGASSGGNATATSGGIGPSTTANRIASAQRRLSVSSATSTARVVGHHPIPVHNNSGSNPMSDLSNSISASLLGLHHQSGGAATGPPGSAASVRAAAAAAAHAAAFEYMQAAVRDREDGLIHGAGQPGGPAGTGDASAMKDYAESTMKELLGLYGFGDMNPDAMSKDAPMPNFPPGLGPSSSPLSTSLFKEHGKSSPVDYTRYVKRFSNATECGSNYCKDLNYREHFHCLDCNSRVFIKKEEMIRHFKWHKKRDESLQHGFLRYSPMDDCSEKFPNCAHNRKQTHYHCLKDGCDKVYISTSDVQMHANYHRKDSAIIQEGFQRYRATEDCGTPGCIFAGQRTTHFHCRRQNCNYTFKNKADMEKHKSYHIKDEQLNRDGFKKFMKHEHCSFENCRFSRVCNHIHCIRPGCIYVLHSSGQLYSHKRKHERRENEMAYRKFKLAQSMMRTLGENQVLALKSMGDDYKSSEAMSNQMHGSIPLLQSSGSGLPGSMSSAPSDNINPENSAASYTEALQRSLNKYTALLQGGNHSLDPSIVTHGFIPGAEHLAMMDINPEMLKMRSDDTWKKYLSRFTANDPCKASCDFLYKDHYHCNAENCTMVFRSKDGVREHARNHEQQDQVTDAFYTTIDAGQSNCCPSDCPFQSKERHYHCGWQSCREIIVPADKPFRRLDHYKMHEYSHKLNLSKDPLTLSMSSVDGIFKRKRGRPPKNRVIEFPFTSGPSDFPQAIYTSFKLPKPNHHQHHQQPMMSMFDKSPAFMTSPSTSMSPTVSKSSAISPSDMMSSPLAQLAQNMMQTKVELQDGFHVFAAGAPCPLMHTCPHAGRHHYHCAQRRCFYVAERSDILLMHSKDFHDNIVISEGFVFFDRGIDCRLHACHSNKVNQHFHCTRPGCSYSFVRYSTMAQHDAKHASEAASAAVIAANSSNNGALQIPAKNGGPAAPRTRESIAATGTDIFGRSPPSQPHYHQIYVKTERASSTSPPAGPSAPPPPHSSSTNPSEPRTPSPNSSSGSRTTVVKATGTFYPLSAFPHAYNHHKDSSSRTTAGAAVVASIATSRGGSAGGATVTNTTTTNDLQIKCEPNSNEQQQVGDAGGSTHEAEFGFAADRMTAEWRALLESHLAYSSERHCGRSLCKHARQDHVHCTYCNQAFTKLSHLQPHLQSHMGAPSPSGLSSSRLTSEDDSCDQQDFDQQQQAARRRADSSEGGMERRERSHDHRRNHHHHRRASSGDDSSSGSSTHFTTHNRSSPSTDSMQSQPSHSLAMYSGVSTAPTTVGHPNRHQPHHHPGMMMSSGADMLPQHHHLLNQPNHTFPGGMPSAAPNQTLLFPTSHHNQGPTAEELRFSPLHRNGSCGGGGPEMTTGEHRSSPRDCSTSESGGAQSPGANSLVDSEPGSPLAQRGVTRHPAPGSLKRSLSASGPTRLLEDSLSMSGAASATMRMDDSAASSSSESKKAKLAAGCLRMLKEEPVPEGYVRFRFNEDCRYPHCGYREHQTHFHCTRSDCGYSFCDKTRFVQHTARHDRLDTLMGGDFQQFRANVPCGHTDCVYLTAAAAAAAASAASGAAGSGGGGAASGSSNSSNNKASHFHCLKCEFVCTDTNKVVAHRRQHQKLDSINANGFEKFTATQSCNADGCSHNQRQTHYHCMKCQYAVLGLSQMSAHKYRHVE